MAQRRINLKDLVLGKSSRWKLFAPAQAGDAAAGGGAATAPPVGAALEAPLAAPQPAEAEPPTSVLHQLNLSNRRLERLLHELRNEHNAEAELRAIAREVILAVELNPDIALACIFLNQIAGSYAVRHCIETAVVAVVIARAMQKAPKDTLTVTAAALTMNVGMLRHHENFQNKHTPLNREEMAIIHRHPEDSANLLKCAGVEDEEWLSCVLLHHENDDGSGYPAGVASPQVTQNAKLISLADRYCAQVSARNYRRSVLPDQAMRNLLEDHELPLDPVLAEHFAHQLGNYPPGCLVRLQNGEVGVVTQRLSDDGLLGVRCLRGTAGAALADGPLRSTGDSDCSIAEVLSEDQAGVRFSMKQIWGAQASL
ncbi:HD-GYP domain-containing protein [Rugamonas rubra]|uniref:HD-GYP domain, c-di-GMP phosphodiesterase class II (Or its inactivated variant) n=1 Tax=Rugamonas rubra TaxID=758825 RepID=A0A1I4P4P3_9BURK|nr:HD domain-containing phosphohydrolase [Rugamonas rubra]SFM22752.1 HD-GYP domain, c-di-GMP phosphodiesterase class II (or its inactivated variant) [Rugamonas rubra]